MIALKHFKTVWNVSRSVSGLILHIGLVPILALVVCLIAQVHSYTLTVELKYFFFIAIVGMMLYLIATLLAENDLPVIGLFRMFRATYADFLVFFLLYHSMDLLMLSFSAVFFCSELFPTVQFLPGLLVGVVTFVLVTSLLSFWIYHNIPSKTHRNSMRRISPSIKSETAAKLFALFVGSKNRVGIIAGYFLPVVLMVAWLGVKLPTYLFLYIALALLLGFAEDCGISDGYFYYLNVLLHRNRRVLLREKQLIYIAHSLAITMLTVFSALLSGNLRPDETYMPIIILTYFCILSDGAIRYIYSYYPNVREYRNQITFLLLIMFIPAAGLLLSIIFSIKDRKRHVDRP